MLAAAGIKSLNKVNAMQMKCAVSLIVLSMLTACGGSGSDDDLSLIHI